MNKTMDIRFEGGMKINAYIDDMCIPTDLPESEGGERSAPTPFELFLGALGTCVGVYAKRFCEAREIETNGLGISVDCEFAEKEMHCKAMHFTITKPAGFPEKYDKALLKAVEQCTVKKNVFNPPEFTTKLA